MKRGLFVATMFLSVGLFLTEIAPAGEGNPPASPPGSGKDHSVAARVNGIEITTEAVAVMMKSLGTNRGHGQGSSKSIEESKRKALDQLILQELAYQKAKSEGWTVERKVIDDAVINLRRTPGGEGKPGETAGKDQVPEEEMRKRIERNLTLRRIITREVRNKVSVTEEEIRKAYEMEKESFNRPEKTVVIDVVFFLEPGEADSRKKAEAILKKIYDDKEKNPRNLVTDGVFGVREMEVSENSEKELYLAAKNLKVGELSGVIEATGNLHVIKLKEYSPRKESTFEEVKGRVEGSLRSKALQKRLEEWGAELKKDAKVEIVGTAEHP